MRTLIRNGHMRVDYNPYEGRRMRGAIETVLSRGEVIVENGEFVGAAGRGRFLRRSSAAGSTPEDATPAAV